MGNTRRAGQGSISSTTDSNPIRAPNTTSDPASALRDGHNMNPLDQESDYSDDDQDASPHSRTGSKRKRPISVSCELCKQRKVKCDRGQPSCGWCSRNAAQCEYKERRKPGLRAGYGRELEQRLDKLEDILRYHSEVIQASINSNSDLFPPEVAPKHIVKLSSDQEAQQDLSRILGTFHGGNTNSHEPHFLLQRSSDFNTQSTYQEYEPTSVSRPHGEHFSSHTQPSGISIESRLLIKQPSTATQDFYKSSGQTDLRSPEGDVIGSQASPTCLRASDQDMPAYDLLYALVDLYFKHINTWCPILHRKTTLDSLFGPSTLQETDRILLHAIIATTMRYSNDARLTQEKRQHYYQISKQKVLLHGMENSCVKSLQALVILALDFCGSSNGPPGWNIMALITRGVVQLGLAVETTSFSVSPHYSSIYTLRAMVLSDSKDFVEEESRRRLFWMIYMLDRYATIATAFEFALSDKEIDRALPCRDDLWVRNQKVETRWFHPNSLHDGSRDHNVDKPENIGAFGFHCEILNILGQIHDFLKQPVDISALGDVEQWQLRYKELDHMLTAYKFSLPNEYGNMAKLLTPGNKNLNCGWVMLQATYHTATIRLHSSAAYPTTRSPIFTPSYSASQRCHGAVENIKTLGEFVVKNGLLDKLGPPFAFTIWVASRVLLVHGSTVEHNVSPQISFFVELLREMGQYWPVAARYSGLLQRVLDEYRDSERQGEGVTPSSVKILADMRRTAFDLDFLISRQPRMGTSSLNRFPPVTPVRTPAPNELEYLDVFDFFNVPRLPTGSELMNATDQSLAEGENDSGSGSGIPAEAGIAGNSGGLMGQGTGNEFNITNFMVDANSDWLFYQKEQEFPNQ